MDYFFLCILDLLPLTTADMLLLQPNLTGSSDTPGPLFPWIAGLGIEYTGHIYNTATN